MHAAGCLLLLMLVLLLLLLLPLVRWLQERPTATKARTTIWMNVLNASACLLLAAYARLGTGEVAAPATAHQTALA